MYILNNHEYIMHPILRLLFSYFPHYKQNEYPSQSTPVPHGSEILKSTLVVPGFTYFAGWYVIINTLSIHLHQDTEQTNFSLAQTFISILLL